MDESLREMGIARLQRELAEAVDLEFCSVEQAEDNARKVTAQINGPPGPFEGRLHQLDVEITERHPFVSPKIHFVPPIVHPSVDPETGRVNLNLEAGWSASVTLAQILVMVHSMLADPKQYESRYKSQYRERPWTSLVPTATSKLPGCNCDSGDESATEETTNGTAQPAASSAP